MASSEQPLDRFRLPAAREQTSQNAHPPPFLPLAILPPQSQSSPIPAPSPLTGNTHGTSSLPPALAPAEHPLPLFSRRAPLAPPVIRLRAGGVAPKRNSAWRAEKTACLLFFLFFLAVSSAGRFQQCREHEIQRPQHGPCAGSCQTQTVGKGTYLSPSSFCSFIPFSLRFVSILSLKPWYKRP